MRPPFLPPLLAALALLPLACASASAWRRPVTIGYARSDDPWLRGAPCSPDTPGDPAPRIDVVAPGLGDPVAQGQTVRIHYVASLPGGKVVHDTHDDNMPSEIILGSTKTACGFERALAGMRPGEQRRVYLPSALLGASAKEPSRRPANSDLVFVVELYLPDGASRWHGAGPANTSSVVSGVGLTPERVVIPVEGPSLTRPEPLR